MELDSKGKAKEKVCAKALAGDQENERDRKRLQKGKGNFLANNSIVFCGVWTDSNFTLILFFPLRVVSFRIVTWLKIEIEMEWNENAMRWIDRSCLSTLLPSCLSLPLSFILPLCLCVCHLLATKVSHCVVWLVIYLCFLLCCRAHFGANLKVGVSQIPKATEPEEEGAAETAASARGMQTRGKGREVRSRVYGGAEPVHLPATSLPSSPSPSLRARSMR